MSSVIITQSPSEWSTTMRYQENFGGRLCQPTCSEVSTLKPSLKRRSSFDADKENASGGKQVNFEQLVEVRDFESEPPDDASGDQALSPGSQSPYFARGGVDAQIIVSPMMRSSPPQESRVENMVTTAPLKPAGSAGPAPSAPKLLQRPQVAPGSPKPITPHSPHSPPPSMVASHTKPPTMQPAASPLVQALKPEMQRSAAPVMQQSAVPLRSLASVELEKRQAERTRYQVEMEAYKKSLQDAHEQLRRQAEAEIQQLLEEEEKNMQQQTDERTQIPWLAVATTEIQLSDIRQAQLNAPPQTSLVPPAPPLQKPAADELNTSEEMMSVEDILKTWRQDGKTRGADTWNDRLLSQMSPLTPRKELQGDAYVYQQTTAGQRAQVVAPGGAHAVGFGVVSVLKAEMQRSAAPVMQKVMHQPDSPVVGESNLCNTSKLKLEEAENSFKRLQELQMRFASTIDTMQSASTVDTMLSQPSTTSKQQLRQNENAGTSSGYGKQVMAAKKGMVLHNLTSYWVNKKSLPHSEPQTAYNSSQPSSQPAYGSAQQAQIRQILYQKELVKKQKEAYAAHYQGAMPIQQQQGYYQ